ncbi:HTH-type sugar sensing transcriptional regulator TrmBL1 [Candidatus Burarchaeum australiense]|nr:HTH-type sugar sensing transcriptional regulator TrmBL1 [Candidatus Burarchaeum australiense]
MNEEGLQLIGLTRNDARIYLALARFGPLKAGEVERRTGIHRRNVYDSLNRLEKRGFVSQYMLNKVQVFQAAEIDAIIGELGKKQELLGETIQEFKGMEREAKVPEVQLLVGENGVKFLMDDEAKTAKTVYAISTSGFECQIWDFLEKTPHKITQGMAPTKIIFVESDRKIAERAKRFKFTDVRFVPDVYRSSVGFDIYGDNVAILMKTAIIKIKNEEIAASFRRFFDYLWKIGKKKIK